MTLSAAPAPSSVLTDAELLASGRDVLGAEARALQKIADQLDQNFIQAVNLIVSCKGRVIVSGMGKSGHIARKIAATMASTGTPAFFVHPGEASHGDLGMIVPDDVVLAMSNSGETAELRDLVDYTRRFSIALIGMTGRPNSTLATASDVALVLPQEPEVSGALGLAPTTSTTMMLALGDALAVGALERKGFTKEDYHNFHPGGKLGKILLRVSEVMHTEDLPLVRSGDPMSQVLVVMTQRSFGCAGIVDINGKLIGIITDGDLRRHMSPDLLKQAASAVMTANPLTVGPRLLASEATKILNEKKRTNLFVVDENHKPVGILHIHDLLRAGIA